MNGLDYNERVTSEMHNTPFSYYYVDNNHTAYRAPAHWHRQLELVRVLSGRLSVHLDDTEYVLTDGNFLFINMEMIHGFFPENCVYEIINFDAEQLLLQTAFCKEELQIFVNRHILLLPKQPISDPVLTGMLHRLFDRAAATDALNHLLILGTLFDFLGTIYDTHAYVEQHRRSTNAKAFRPLLEYIDASYMKPITLTDMAKVSKMSVSHFSAMFRDFFHQTPMDYLNHYRIEKACLLLNAADTPVTEVAYHCGFNDSAYFTKVFKKYRGITPKKYRMQFREN